MIYRRNYSDRSLDNKHNFEGRRLVDATNNYLILRNSIELHNIVEKSPTHYPIKILKNSSRISTRSLD